MRKRRRLIVLSIIGIVLLFFFAPVYRATVSPYMILPLANECYIHEGGVAYFAPSTVYTSLSYVTLGHLVTGSSYGITISGLFGLIYVPANGWNSIQFPPIGYQSISCS